MYDNLTNLGRVIDDKERLILSDSASGICFYTSGEVHMDIAPEIETFDKDSCPYIAVIIDDDYDNVLKIPVYKLLKQHKISENSDFKRKITLIKITEEQFLNISLSNLKFSKEIEKVKKSDKKLHIIGDSISAGYGVLGINNSSEFTTKQEDVLKAYSFLLGKALNMDTYIFAQSGNGIISRWIEPNADTPNTYNLIPNIYPFDDKNAYPQADIIVINLGSNDISYIKDKKDRLANFLSEYEKFIKKIRTKNKNAYIYISYGVIENSLVKPISSMIKNCFKEKEDKIFFVEIDIQREEEGIGAIGHPGINVHKRMADTLYNEIMKHF